MSRDVSSDILTNAVQKETAFAYKIINKNIYIVGFNPQVYINQMHSGYVIGEKTIIRNTYGLYRGLKGKYWGEEEYITSKLCEMMQVANQTDTEKWLSDLIGSERKRAYEIIDESIDTIFTAGKERSKTFSLDKKMCLYEIEYENCYYKFIYNGNTDWLVLVAISKQPFQMVSFQKFMTADIVAAAFVDFEQAATYSYSSNIWSVGVETDYKNLFDKESLININCYNEGAQFLYSCYEKKVIVCQYKGGFTGERASDVEENIKELISQVVMSSFYEYDDYDDYDQNGYDDYDYGDYN